MEKRHRDCREAAPVRRSLDTVSDDLVSRGPRPRGVLLLMSLPYYLFLDQTTLAPTTRRVGCVAPFVGILAQSGGFFVHMIVGQPNAPSIGTFITTAEAILLATAIGILVYGLVTIR